MDQPDAQGLKWYAVHVRSRHENQVYKRLDMKGVEAFLPTVERLRKWKDRKKLVAFPLFPGYLFVHLPKSSLKVLEVLKIRGVVRLLSRVPGDPEPVPDEQILSLKRLIESKEALDPYPYLTEGERVRIRRGPLMGVEGILTEKLGRHMLVLCVDILRQGVAVTVNAADVEKI